MRRVGRSEEGAVLVAVLAFLVFFGVVVSAVLGFVDTGLRTTQQIRDQGDTLYAADGAMNAAISQVTHQVDVDPTFGASHDLGNCEDYEVPLNDRSIVVTCEPQDGSREVIIGGGDVDPSNTPAYAILTLGTGAGDGFTVRNNDGDATFRAAGDVASNGPVTVTNNPVEIDGDVTATSCAGAGTLTVTAGNTLNCAGTPTFVDPAYARATDTRPPDVTTLPLCTPVVLMEPGTYTDAEALSNFINGCNASFVFVGTFYFDFADTGNINCGGTNATHQLCIDNANATIVGGTPDPPGAPTACVLPGTQWIFGGDSRLNVQAGSVTLCATPHASQQRIVIYAKSLGSAEDPVTQTVTLNAATATSSKTGNTSDFTNVDGTTDIDDAQVATATVAKNKTATVTLESFPELPENATIDEVRLRFKHAETPAASIDRLAVSVRPGNGGNNGSDDIVIPDPSEPGCTYCQEVLGEHQVDLTARLTSLEQLNGMRVTYSLKTTNPQGNTPFVPVVATLDGIVVDVTYTTPPSVPWGTQSGCVLSGAAAPCDLITTDGSNTSVRILGTIYAPASSLSLKTVNNGLEVVQRGVVARSLYVEVPTVSYDPGVSISIPTNEGGIDGITPAHVILRAFLNEVERLEAEVIVDNEADPPVEIVRWEVRR